MFMYIVRSMVSLALIVALGYSQCTGGMFALPMAFAADLNLQEIVIDQPLMSKEQNVCFDDLMSHAQEEDHQEGDHIEKEHVSNCGEGSPCMRQSQQILTISQSLYFSDDEHIINDYIKVDETAAILTKKNVVPQARAGPLYAFAKTAVHILVKRE